MTKWKVGVVLAAAAAAVGAAVFVWRKKKGDSNVFAPNPGKIDPGSAGGVFTAKLAAIERLGLDSISFTLEVTNDTQNQRTAKVAVHAEPGGLEVGLDNFDDARDVTLDGGTKQLIRMTHSDLAFAPLSQWHVFVTVDGVTTDER